mmetsp:Transcript_1646/g.3692  ORF Transcript_1646/g.3692 Transcript_1646/m.3692 type:complete len:165 (-) Transcript_1646:553-1047(-)
MPDLPMTSAACESFDVAPSNAIVAILQCQNQRARTYASLALVLRSTSLPETSVTNALNNATVTFNEIGAAVNEQITRLPDRLANVVSSLQQMEREKLQVTVRQATLRRERARLEQTSGGADGDAFDGRGEGEVSRELAECTREMQRIVEGINACMEELQEELEE